MINTKLPLCVDLDGTLIEGDVTFETLIQFIREYPLKIPMLFWWFMKGKNYLKTKLAGLIEIRADLLPYNESFLAFLKMQVQQGQKIVLATASDIKFAQAVAKHLGIFSEVFASNASVNLKAAVKAEVLVQKYGEGQFIYAGNSRADLPVWKKSQNAIAVNTPKGVQKELQKFSPPIKEFPRTHSTLQCLLRAMRPHQWFKNTPLFLPLVMSQQIWEGSLFLKILSLFTAFCLGMSALYIFNDLLNLEIDRQHPRKKVLPFARGQLSVPLGVGVSLVLLMCATLAGLFVGSIFLIFLLGALCLTILSLRGKWSSAIMNLLLLAGLFAVCVLAGSVAIGLEHPKGDLLQKYTFQN